MQGRRQQLRRRSRGGGQADSFRLQTARALDRDHVTALNKRLQQIDSPKSIVLISGGLAFPGSEMSRLLDLERSVAASGTSLYVIHVEQPDADASNRGRPGAAALPRNELREGLENIAGATDGEMFTGVGKAVGIFERVQSEILNSYQIGVESIPRDADGKSHKIDVQVRAGGLTVKACQQLILTHNARARTPTEVLGLPVERNDAPMAASAYVLRGEEPSELMVLTLVELLRGAAPRPLSSYAVTIEGDDGVMFSNAADLQETADNAGRAIIATHLAPGSYRLRAAGQARFDLPLRVVLRLAPPFQVSDLLLGTLTDKFAPAEPPRPERQSGGDNRALRGRCHGTRRRARRLRVEEGWRRRGHRSHDGQGQPDRSRSPQSRRRTDRAPGTRTRELHHISRNSEGNDRRRQGQPPPRHYSSLSDTLARGRSRCDIALC